MREYFYLVSSLVTLNPEVAPPVNSDTFTEMCKELLAPEDYLELSGAELIDSKGIADKLNKNSVLAKYWSWDGNLRNLLVDVLAEGNSGDKYKRYEKDFFSETVLLKNEAFAQNNPLEREEYLFNARWNYLDELTGSSSFDISVLVAYKLRLLLLEQRQKYHHKAGVEKLESLIDELVNKSNSDSSPAKEV